MTSIMSEQKIQNTNALPVPIGGQRIPNGLTAKPNATALSAIPALPGRTSFGPQYTQLKAQREKLDELRKCVMAVPRYVALLRKVDLIIAKTNKSMNQPEQKENKDNKLKSLATKRVVQKEQRDKALAELTELQTVFQDNAEIDEGIKFALSGAQNENMTKQQNADFGETLKRLAQTIFGMQAKLLSEMKEAKKAFVESQKENPQ